MTRLEEFLTDEVKCHEEEKDVKLTQEQRMMAVKGLKFYIEVYLAEQIPEQIEDVSKIKEER